MSDFTGANHEKTQGEKLMERLERIKQMLDDAYFDTKEKYSKVQADNAIINYFLYDDRGFFTGTNNRKKLKILSNHEPEVYQILFDYAMSKYISEEDSGIRHKVTLEDIKKYVDPKGKGLNYNEQFVTSAIAIGAAWNPYWTINTVNNNPELKRALVNSFVKGRYSNKTKRAELDNSKRYVIRKQSDGREIKISKDTLNKRIDKMSNDAGIEPFDPDKI